MKEYRKETKTETHTRNVLVCRKCDLCGYATKKNGWDEGIYEINDTEISVKIYGETGHSWPEGSGDKVFYDIDLCPLCFKNKLVPWLNSQGANIERQETDW